MAKNEIFAVYDEAGECFVQFLPSQNEKLARMTFEKMFKEKRFNIPLLYDYPECFKVYKLGTFDDNTGLFENLDHHYMLLDFATLMVGANNPSSVL